MSTLLNTHHLEGCPWTPLSTALGVPNVKYCESPQCGWITEPANTWSNLGYFIFVFLIYYQTRKDSSRILKAFAPAIFCMGAFSFIFHASNLYVTQLVDFLGMFLYLFLMMCANFLRARKLKAHLFWKVYLISSFASVPILFALTQLGITIQIIFLVCALGLGVTEVIAKKNSSEKVNYNSFKTSLFFILSAEAFSLLDMTRVWCQPDNHFIQGHAVWHLLSGIGVYYSYRFYRQFKLI